MLHPERVRAILFDLDGTLADTDDAYVHRLAGFFRPVQLLHRKFDPYAFARKLVMSAESPTNALLHLLDRLSLDETLGPLLNTLHRLRGEAGGQHLSMIPGTLSILDGLKPRYPLAIVTSRERHSTISFLEIHNLMPYFHCIATARTCRQTKPHPAPILWTASQIGVPPEDCVMVGDTTVDIRSGVTAGSQAIGVLCGFGEHNELEFAGADLILETTADLLNVL